MIWRTRNGRWLDRFGQWHAWFAWHPVSLEPPAEAASRESLATAWLEPVARIGVVVRGRRYWLYALPADVGLGQPALPPAELRRRARRGGHLRAVK